MRGAISPYRALFVRALIRLPLIIFALVFLWLIGGRARVLAADSFDSSVLTSGTLFIEAEDADFGHGQFVTNKKIGMDGPYDGGAYKNLGTQADAGFDWQASGPDGQLYRPNTGISAGEENGSNGHDRGTFQVKDSWTLGWNDPGEWYNYTRMFPSAATDYVAFAHASSGGNPINIELDEITAGVGLDDSQQIKQKLGVFAPGSPTAGWNTLELFPLTDDGGKLITVRLGGKTTLRTSMMLHSNEDVDYYAFVPVTGPFVRVDWTPASVQVTLYDTTSAVDAGSVSLKMNGVAVTPSINQVNGRTMAQYDVPIAFAAGSSKLLEIFYADADGHTYSSTSSFIVPNYLTVSPATAVVPDASKPGFAWNYSQVDSTGDYLENSNARTEAQLQGLLGDNTGDPTAQGAALGPAAQGADRTAPFNFEVAGPINFDKLGVQFGFFPDNVAQMPGSPGINGTTFQAAEALTYLDLPAGYVTMGVASDDGFRVTTGANFKDVFATRLGEFDGVRGTTETLFSFVVLEAGVYPFRLIWENGGGGSNVSWYSVTQGGSRHLIGDASDPEAIKAYRAKLSPVTPAYIKSFWPIAGAVPAPSVAPAVAIVLSDVGTAVDQSSISLKMADAYVSPTISKSGPDTIINYMVSAAFPEGAVVPLELSFSDSAGTSRSVNTLFTTEITTKSFVPGTLFIEAEDADYDHGKYVTNERIGMDGPYSGGSYNGLGTVNDTDFDWFSASFINLPYRPLTGLSVDKRSEGTDRGLFQVTDSWTLGWNGQGDWQNYTREFPVGAGNYKVYGRFASAAPIKVRLDQVIAGQTLEDSQQVKATLGYFDPRRSTLGWENYEIFPLVDDSGTPAIVNVASKITLRATTLPEGLQEIDYYAFVPVPLITAQPLSQTVAVGNIVNLSVGASMNGSPLFFQWQQRAFGAPTFTDIAGATSASYSTPLLTPGDDQVQYRVVVSTTGYSTNSDIATVTVEFPLSMVSDSDGQKIQFNSTLNSFYPVEANGSFPSGGWVTVAGVSGTGSLMQVTNHDAFSMAQRTYRVSNNGKVSQYAGFKHLGLPGNSDTLVSMPFIRPAMDYGTIASISAGVIKVSAANQWVGNQWTYAVGIRTNTYFVLLLNGTMEGSYYTITGNGLDTLTLDLEGGALTGVSPGDSIAIVPYWTLGTIFSGGQGVNASTSPANRSTEVLIPDLTDSGINLSASRSCYFWNGAWRQVGQGTAIKNDDVILPDMPFWVRQNVSTATDLLTQGALLSSKMRIPLRRNGTGKQDNFVSLQRAFSFSLDASGLISSGVFQPSTSSAARTDQLLTFDNTPIARNKSASGCYYNLSGGWRKIGAAAANVGAELVFAPGTGAIVRMDSTGPVVWTNERGY
jgi:uncharacterized protein (TIGR02597 family)